MNILVPIDIVESDGIFKGSYIFDDSFIVEGKTPLEVASRLYSNIKVPIQMHKACDVIEGLEDLQEEEKTFIKVDYFSIGEHLIFIIIYTLCLSLVCIPIFVLLSGFIASQILPFFNDVLSTDNLVSLSQFIEMSAILRISFFILFWNIGYFGLYKMAVDYYANFLHENESIKEIHLSLITQVTMILYDDNYEIQGL
ncbi:MAG: hypothetical protein COB02_03025 [Candidatus Cloacimonadota bacterium]|nr:MAG: hypothetical protein COB02_03025 [Candidatus Cloacimonadota bacterium]